MKRSADLSPWDKKISTEERLHSKNYGGGTLLSWKMFWQKCKILILKGVECGEKEGCR